jgi:hypothetical protein
MKSNNANASTKQSDKHAAIEQGAHDSGKPVEHKEGDGWHSGRKLPKVESVREVDATQNENACVEAAKKQNQSATSDGTIVPNVVVNTGKSVFTGGPN